MITVKLILLEYYFIIIFFFLLQHFLTLKLQIYGSSARFCLFVFVLFCFCFFVFLGGRGYYRLLKKREFTPFTQLLKKYFVLEVDPTEDMCKTQFQDSIRNVAKQNMVPPTPKSLKLTGKVH